MRAIRLCLPLPVCLLLGGPIVLDRPGHSAAPPPRSAEPPTEGRMFMARLVDGSQVRLTLLEHRLLVKTAYGRLVVPLADVNRVEFGSRITDATKRDVHAAVALLGSKSFEEREAAGKKLEEIGPASYAALQEAGKSKDLEVARRAKSLLAKLEAAHTEEQLARREDDVIHAARFTIVGRIDADTLAVRAPFFGKASLNPTDLYELQSDGSASTVALTVAAAKYAGPAVAWMETEFGVAKGKKLKVVTTGQIDMYPQAPWVGQYMATAAGAPPAWGGVRGPDGNNPGVLIGRIGKDGKEFVLGAEYEGEARSAGRLYLRIAPSPWNNSAAGEYKVMASQR